MYQAVMFVESTPGDKLLKMLRNTEEKHMIAKNKRLKAVSKSGTKLINMLQKNDPFQQNCKKPDCQPCKQAENSGKLTDCRKVNVTYESKCNNCDKEGKYRAYHGESARNFYSRSKEHVNDAKNM